MTKMKMMNIETSEIQTINTIKAPSILICISKCRNLNNPSSGGPVGTTTAPPPLPGLETPTHCNTINYDDVSSNCQLAFITGATKWASRNALPSSTTNAMWTRVFYNETAESSPAPPPFG